MSASEGIEAAMAAGDDALAVASEDEQHEEAGSLLQIGSLFECCPWFHGALSRHVADSLLMQNGSQGTYMLRECVVKGSDNTGNGTLAISVRTADAVKHYRLEWDGSQYTFATDTFPSVQALVDHFDSCPTVGSQGVRTRLAYPYPRVVNEFASYETVRVNTEWHGMTAGKKDGEVAPHLSTASHEGYLTKLGNVKKSWKNRWFVLWKNELKYFRDRADMQPVRTLDLGVSAGIAPTVVKGKENCFSISMPGRVYYMFASTPEEMTDWVQILQAEAEKAKADRLR